MPDDDLMDVLTRRRRSPDRDTPAEPQGDSTLPDANRPYEAFARPANRPLYSLHCILGKDGYRSFQLMHLDSNTSFEVDAGGHVIRLRFNGSKVTAVTIRGRNLNRLYDDLHQHRTAWVRRVDGGRDFGKDSEPVVTAIEIAEERESQAGT